MVNEACGDGTAGHAVVPGGFRVLNEHQSAFFLDRPQAQCALGTRTRKNDTDGPFALILGQRAEKEVDGMSHPPGHDRLQQLKRPFQHRHVFIGRNDVHAIRVGPHSVFRLNDVHFRVPLQQFGHDALMFGSQMGYQDKGHAAVGRHVGEEVLERLQSSGRGAYADNVEGILYYGAWRCYRRR